MNTTHLDDLHRSTALDPAAPWSGVHGIPPATIAAYKARGRQLRAKAVRNAFVGLAGIVARGARRLSRSVPSGALGPSGVDMDCAYGRPC